MTRWVSLLMMLVLSAALGLTFYQFLAPYLLPLFMAAVFAILCQPFLRWWLRVTGGRRHLSAGMTTVIVLALLLGPLITGTIVATAQLYGLARGAWSGQLFESESWRRAAGDVRSRLNIDQLAARVHEWTGETVSTDELERQLRERLGDAAAGLARRTFGAAGSTLSYVGDMLGVLVSAFIFVIAFYYFLADGPNLLDGAQRLIPVNPEYQRQLLQNFAQVVRAVVLATFAAALGQGLATGIGLRLCGFEHFFISTLLATLTALVPFMGTWLVWVPAAAWLAYTGHWGAAGFLTVYGAVFVGFLDNIIRTYVLHSNVSLHPLLALVSVMGGLQVFGLWGVFIGPVVASVLHASARLLNAELSTMTLEWSILARPPSESPGRTETIPAVVGPARPRVADETPASDPSPIALTDGADHNAARKPTVDGRAGDGGGAGSAPVSFGVPVMARPDKGGPARPGQSNQPAQKSHGRRKGRRPGR